MRLALNSSRHNLHSKTMRSSVQDIGAGLLVLSGPRASTGILFTSLGDDAQTRLFRRQPRLARRLVAPPDLRLGLQAIAHEMLQRLRDDAVFGRSEVSFAEVLDALDQLLL